MAFAVGGGLSLLLVAARGRLGALRQPPLAWLHGVGGLFGYHALYFAALALAPPVEANLLNYLWPLLITTKESFYTVVMTVSRQANVVDSVPSWNLLMAMAMLAMLPPVLVVVFMQRQFVRGLVETEK